MHSKKIEEIAVQSVKREILRCDLLSDEIPTNDKTPTWDGEIWVYNNTNQKKDTLYGKVPVQVKGKKVGKLSRKEIKYKLMKADLENYYNNNGAIFFVVEIVSTDIYKVFYLSLLPIDIKLILTKMGENQSIQGELKKLPETKKSLEVICRNFVFHSRKQGYSLLNDLKFDINTSFSSIKSTIITTHNSFTNDLLEYGTYAYGYIEELNLDVPLYKMAIESIEEDTDIYIGTGGKNFYTATRFLSKENTSIVFGASFIIDINQTNLEKLDINFSLKGTIQERIYDLKYLSEVLRNKSIEINGHTIQLSSFTITEKFQNELPVLIKDLETLEQTLSKLEINIEIDPTKLSKKELLDLRLLKEVIVDRDFSGVRVVKDKPFIHFEILGEKIVLVSLQREEEKIIFNLFDAETLHKNIMIRAESITDATNQAPHSPYILFEKSELFNYTNFNVEALIKAFVSLVDYSNDYALTITNQYLLETLAYYDQNKNRKELLLFAERVFEHLETIDPNSLLYFINRMQTIKRYRHFTEKEEELIIEKKSLTPSSEIESICGLLLLLDSKFEFKVLFNKLTEESKKNFKEYPIYNLFDGE
ncbi:hypothetical protein [Bacillus mycoides]|uniref:hypothetical protein n=1 Tax=Bacillus mycoides TaxID=1405 RepID=UPI0010BE51F0|nr:hypothetical protein [Bacillus mycoides]TKI46726.1 hypothetical protein FC700_09255 [Bacillus mycoides]